MPGTKEIRSKIASVKSTQKITKAMEMVAASKMRRAQERMRMARPYAAKAREVISHLNEANPDFRHPFLMQRETKSIGIVVVSTDRGLCGALNANVFKATLQLIREWRLDRLFMVHAQFLNTMSQRPQVLQLLPIPAIAEGDTGLQERWDYIYEPSAADILDGLLMRYIESQVYQGAVENVASEMAARMVAMKSAADNAGKLIGELQLVYNKARQAAITKELAEIVGGAAAV